MSNLISVENLNKRYGKRYVLRNINFSLPAGGILGIVGPNGAGKTTTIEIIEGIRKPTSGIVRVFGENPFMNKKTKSKINASLQGNSFFYDLTVTDILRMYLVLYDSKNKLKEITSEFGLEKLGKTKYKNLSGGQKQKLSLSIAFINEAKLIFLDEPTEGLDPISRQHIWRLIKKHHKQGKSFLITSHYMEEIEELCNSVIFLNKGEIIESGKLQNILSKYQGLASEVELSKNIELKLLQSSFKGTKIEANNNTYTFFPESDKDILETLLPLLKKQNIRIVNYKLRKRSLEGIYIKLFGTKLSKGNKIG